MAGRFVATLALITMLAAGHAAHAQSLDPASTAALLATLRMLQDPSARGAAIANDPNAAAVDRQVKALAASPELQQELYGVAAEVFNDLTRGSGGDVGRMTETIQRAQTDPAGFAALLSPATLDRIRALAVKLSDQRR
jgi:hypothetical protein